MRFRTDSTWNRTGATGSVVLAGSPLRVFRLSATGANLCVSIESGDDVESSTLTERLLDAGAIHPQPGISEASWGAPRRHRNHAATRRIRPLRP